MSVGNAGGYKRKPSVGEASEGADRATGTSSHKKLTTSHLNQITVLRAMSQKDTMTKEAEHLQIGEITSLSGLGDEKEVQRYLFILEGQKLVTPHPEGDFTSRFWKITTDGMRALKTIDKSVLSEA